MADKNVVLNGYTFAHKSVARDFAVASNAGILLNFYKGAYLGFVPDLASIQINEFRQLHICSEFYVVLDAVVRVHR